MSDFLTKSELITKSTEQVINLIVQDDPTVVDDIIEESIDVVRNGLFRYYNVDQVFGARGNDRSKTILKFLKAIVIREIFARRSTSMNEVVQYNYDEAMTVLDDLASGKKEIDLPLKQVDSNGDGIDDTPASFFKFGSKKNYENRI